MKKSEATSCDGRRGLIALLAVLVAGCEKPREARLPYNQDNPVLYDNDAADDVYADELLLALASTGEIRLAGMITSSSIAPENPFVPPADFDRFVRDREELVAKAEASGLTNIPPRVLGPNGQLERPTSQRIEDTRPLDSPGSRLIVSEAKKASVEKPLVIVVGGPLTAEADAYLLDPSIADKMVVAWIGGRRDDMGDYNGWSDPWAAYIAMHRLRLIQFTAYGGRPHVAKAALPSLPASPLRDYMVQKHHPTNGDPGDWDADSPPAISLVRPDFALRIKRVSFAKWVSVTIDVPHEVPGFKSDANGRMQVVTRCDAEVATKEWWRAVTKALAPKP